jgi:diacylglycerol kinase (ATP)
MRPVPKPKNYIDSFRYAVEGVAHAFRTQRHMRFHFIVVVLVLALGLLCRFTSNEMALLSLTCAFVIVAELVNTAVEAVVDMITQSYHPLAKLSKDIAAGAVLVASVTALFVGALLFAGKLTEEPERIGISPLSNTSFLVQALIVVVVLVVIVALIIKVLGGKGSVLQGGVISGHAAAAFALATAIIYRTGWDIFVTVLVAALAIMVAQSRVEGKIHTVQEVVVGGLLGMCMTAVVYYFRIGMH